MMITLMMIMMMMMMILVMISFFPLLMDPKHNWHQGGTVNYYDDSDNDDYDDDDVYDDVNYKKHFL